MNLLSAAHIAGYSDIAEVMVCMHSSTNDDVCSLIRGTRVRKMHTSNRNAFWSINAPILAEVSPNGDLRVFSTDYKQRNKQNEVKLKLNFEEKIAIVKAYPGSNPEIIDWYVDQGYKGIIIEGTGLGHTPTIPPSHEAYRSWTPHIERAIESEIFVGVTSQCIFGRVHPYVYRALRLNKLAGVTYLEDMTTETAYIKMGHILGYYSDIDVIVKEMLTNYVGEISHISHPPCDLNFLEV